MAVVMNANQKKEMVKAAQQYFSATMTPDVAVRSMESLVLMYRCGRGKVQVQVIFDANTFWLSQQRMAELFGVTQQNISYHLSQIEESGELHLSDAYKKIVTFRQMVWRGDDVQPQCSHCRWLSSKQL
jgi:predicted transcriptional regulator